MAFTTLIIDLDGTLWDSALWLASMLESDPQKQEAVAGILSDPGSGLSAAKALGNHGVTKAKFAKLCASRVSELHLYEDGISQLVAASERVRLGVVTSLPGWIALPMLDGTGVRELFDVVETASWGMPAKPSPAGLKRALEKIEGHADQAIFVGDSSVDQKAACAAGIHFAWASWGYGRAINPEIRLNSWRDIQDLL